MKIRTDFVTNSSSSSFTLMIKFDLENGDCVRFDAMGGTPETGRVNYFDADAIVNVSPRQLGVAKNIDDLIQMLENGVYDEFETKTKIFEKSNPMKCMWGEYDAYDFILEIKEKIKSMDQIREITISGDEKGSGGECYNRSYTYNLKTKAYTGIQEGHEFDKDGSSGGDLELNDLFLCDESSFHGWEDVESDNYVMTVPIEGTAYKGRAARFEYIKEGDTLTLKADYNNKFFTPVAIECFNSKNETLGYISAEEDVLKECAKALDDDVLVAKVLSVTPLSKRRKGAKHALMDIELYIK